MQPVQTGFFQRAPEEAAFPAVGSLEWWNVGLQTGPGRCLDDDEVYTGKGANQRAAGIALDMGELQSALRCLHPAQPFTPQAALLSSAALGQSPQCLEILQGNPEALLSVHNEQGLTPALLAAWGGHIGTLSVLMAMDARCVYASDVHGHTAAHLAAWKGLDFVINVLHLHDPKLLLGRTARRGSTPAHLAAASGQTRCLLLLREISPGILEARDHQGFLPLDRCELAGPRAEVMDAMGGQARMLESLLSSMSVSNTAA